MNQYKLTAPCHFGLEKTLSFEIKKAGGTDVTAADGRLFFKGGEDVIARLNIISSVAERVGIVLGEFSAKTFDQVFEGAKKAPLELFCGKNGKFPVVKGHSINSALTSIPAVQRTVKKALAQRLEAKYGNLPETGAAYPIYFLINKDRMLLTLDTSGTGLHKRGYRAFSNAAPIKETLAAGIADLARVRAKDTVIDPFCGSGTILIESVYKALRIAPGLNRGFLAMDWDCFSKKTWEDAFEQARSEIITDKDFVVRGYDIDAEAVKLTEDNAWKAGVEKHIRVEKRDIADFKRPDGAFKLITNPPYGERMAEGEAEAIYGTMGKVLLPSGENQQLFVICGNENFEDAFGEKAAKNRKLYNGMLMCRLYCYGV